MVTILNTTQQYFTTFTEGRNGSNTKHRENERNNYRTPKNYLRNTWSLDSKRTILYKARWSRFMFIRLYIWWVQKDVIFYYFMSYWKHLILALVNATQHLFKISGNFYQKVNTKDIVDFKKLDKLNFKAKPLSVKRCA